MSSSRLITRVGSKKRIKPRASGYRKLYHLNKNKKPNLKPINTMVSNNRKHGGGGGGGGKIDSPYLKKVRELNTQLKKERQYNQLRFFEKFNSQINKKRLHKVVKKQISTTRSHDISNGFFVRIKEMFPNMLRRNGEKIVLQREGDERLNLNLVLREIRKIEKETLIDLEETRDLKKVANRQRFLEYYKNIFLEGLKDWKEYSRAMNVYCSANKGVLVPIMSKSVTNRKKRERVSKRISDYGRGKSIIVLTRKESKAPLSEEEKQMQKKKKKFDEEYLRFKKRQHDKFSISNLKRMVKIDRINSGELVKKVTQSKKVKEKEKLIDELMKWKRREGTPKLPSISGGKKQNLLKNIKPFEEEKDDEKKDLAPAFPMFLKMLFEKNRQILSQVEKEKGIEIRIVNELGSYMINQKNEKDVNQTFITEKDRMSMNTDTDSDYLKVERINNSSVLDDVDSAYGSDTRSDYLAKESKDGGRVVMDDEQMDEDIELPVKVKLNLNSKKLRRFQKRGVYTRGVKREGGRGFVIGPSKTVIKNDSGFKLNYGARRRNISVGRYRYDTKGTREVDGSKPFFDNTFDAEKVKKKKKERNELQTSFEEINLPNLQKMKHRTHTHVDTLDSPTSEGISAQKQFGSLLEKFEIQLKKLSKDTNKNEKRQKFTVTLKKLIGQGSFAQVFLGKLRFENEKGNSVAIQVAIKRILVNNKFFKDTFVLAEIEILRRLSSDYLVRYYGCKFSKKNMEYSIIMEYVDITLKEYIDKRKGKRRKFSEQRTATVLVHILKGVQHLHKSCIIHRDLKSSNILINSTGEIKLGDFGVSTLVSKYNSIRRSCVGTPSFSSYEILMGEEYSFQTDIWSVGSVALHMLCGKAPFADICNDGLTVADKICKLNIRKYVDALGVSATCKDFLKQCFIKNWKKRPSATKLLKHKFVNMKEKRLSISKKLIDRIRGS